MPRTLLPLLWAAVLFGLVTGARAADDDPKAILTRAVKAHGGAEVLTRNKAGQSKNKGKITLPGVGEVDFTQEAASMWPDKMKETMELEIGGQKLTVVTRMNGDKTSIETNGNPVDITDNIKKALPDALYMLKAARLVSLIKNKDYELSPLGEIKVEGKPAVGVLVKSKGQKDLSLFFDKNTGLLAKVERRTFDAGSGKEITEERIILEYMEKNKEGIPAPKKVLVKHDGQKFLEAEALKVKFLEKLEDSLFNK